MQGGKDMDVLVIGGGPGGYAAALKAAHGGLSVTLVERARVGGTCLNIGCIPTKSLLETAAHWATAVRNGWVAESSMSKQQWEHAQIKKRRVVEQLTAGVKALLKNAGVRLVSGTARFVSPHKVVVAERNGKEISVTFDRAIIATGSQALLPSIVGIDEPGVYTSDTILSIEDVPKRLVIVGGGVIGLEFASMFRQLGSRIDVVEFADEILPRMDRTTVQALKRQLTSHGISFYTRASVQRIERHLSGFGLNVTAKYENGETFGLEADAVLVAIGRAADLNALDLGKAGIQLENRRIRVNSYCQTNLPHVYAIGDCSNPVMLAHAAMMDAEVAVAHILGKPAKRKNRFMIPQCIYTLPELASVGMTEEEVAQAGVNYEVSEIGMQANGKALIGEFDGMCRMISERGTGIVLGIHLVGPHVTEIIQEAALALELEVTTKELARTIHAHPTVSEVLHETALVSLGVPVHVPKRKTEVAQ